MAACTSLLSWPTSLLSALPAASLAAEVGEDTGPAPDPPAAEVTPPVEVGDGKPCALPVLRLLLPTLLMVLSQMAAALRKRNRTPYHESTDF